ncbi:major capsid protein [robinz microvirus RP_82]|nr:major capsid protein [robinz microvirus RP_82]
MMARMPSVMNHTFSQVPKAEIPRSSFDRSSGYKSTINSGYLTPLFCDEVLPGDTFSLNMSVFARLATPLHPIMDNMFISSFWFFVPLRLVWTNFQKFMGEQANPGDSIDYLVPQMSPGAGGYGAQGIYDYLGLPVGVAGFNHSSLPLRAYNLIWNEWFRDQNLQNSVTVPKGDTNDPTSTYTLLRRGKRHDYFTSALPWPQKGPGMSIPLGTTAPILGLTTAGATFTASAGAQIGVTAVGDIPVGTPVVATSAAAAISVTGQSLGLASPTNRPQVFADLSNASAATINQLRQAFQVQKLYERDARGGTRYTEIVRAHFNVVSPDARLQRPEYLGGGQSSVSVHQVPQTAQADDSPTGTLGAYGTAAFSGHGFSKSFTEHGIILGMVSVRADLNYQQGLNRMWSRRTKLDFYWPALAMIGEQTILNKEIYCQGTAADENVFGYQERFAEYRYRPSIITSQMRSSYAQSLDTWHLAQDFIALPALNAAFIQDDPPIARIIAVPTEPQFILDAFFKLRCARPMPVFGVPGLIDHF